MRIITKRGYHYLQTSFRVDGKTITKDKYLGKGIPKNLEEIKKQFLGLIQGETLFKRFDVIKSNYLKNWNKLPIPVKKKIHEELTARFTYNTNAIEGSTITLEETKRLLKDHITPEKPLADVQESINHAKIFSDIIDNEYHDLSLKNVMEWHKQIFRESKPEIAGKVRDYLVRVGDHLCPDWQDVPRLLKEFLQWYNTNKKELHPVELVGMAHYRFVKIHPFGDGNGRIARLIMNFILNARGYPVLIIEFNKRTSYYKSLRRADKKTEWEFLKYHYRRYLKNNEEFL
ncbi:MAG: Fic family protein [Nanoarchaeota archaeon]|nr:Fic family protein [Nanoarchaeota archaeon]